jgi:hypothetical protein
MAGSGSDRRHRSSRGTHSTVISGTSKIMDEITVSNGSLSHGGPRSALPAELRACAGGVLAQRIAAGGVGARA